MKNNKVLVLGIGDVVLHHEAKGLHAVKQMLTSVDWPGDVDVIQRLNDQCQLQPEWLNYEHLVIVIAAPDHKMPGTVHVIRAGCNDCFTSCGITSPGLQRMVETLMKAPDKPEVYLVVITIKETEDDSDFSLSRAVAAVLPQVHMLLRGLVGMLTRKQECVYF